MLPSIDEIVENFELLDEQDDRYRYLIELGRQLPPLAPEERVEANRVRGCVAQVWLVTEGGSEGGRRVLRFRGESDAHITQGLVALLVALTSGRTPEEIAGLDAMALFQRVHLAEHLTAQRSNGLRSMLDRIRADARLAQAA